MRRDVQPPLPAASVCGRDVRLLCPEAVSPVCLARQQLPLPIAIGATENENSMPVNA